MIGVFMDTNSNKQELSDETIKKIAEQVKELIDDDEQINIHEDFSIDLGKDELSEEEQVERKPYLHLSKLYSNALRDIVKDIEKIMLQENKGSIIDIPTKIKIRGKVDDSLNQIVQGMDEVLRATYKIRDDEIKEKEFRNPLYFKIQRPNIENLRERFFNKLFYLRIKKGNTSNWLSLLIAGIGLITLWNGIEETIVYRLSAQGMIVLGISTLGLIAWLQRQKVFQIFGE